MGRLESRARRVSLVVGLGFLSVVVGVLLSTKLFLWLASLGDAPVVVRVLLNGALSTLWAWAVLPAFAYGFGRVIDLRPVPTAAGAVATGFLFLFGVQLVGSGPESFRQEWVLSALRVLFIAGGGALTARCVRAARAAAVKGEEAATAEATRIKSQYDAFAQEAQRVAERREAVPIRPEEPGEKKE